MSDRSKQGRAIPAEVVRRCLINKPETGMGYQTGNVVLSNGQIIRDVAFVDGEIAEVRGYSEIPFDAVDVVEVELTHVRWQFLR